MEELHDIIANQQQTFRKAEIFAATNHPIAMAIINSTATGLAVGAVDPTAAGVASMATAAVSMINKGKLGWKI